MKREIIEIKHPGNCCPGHDEYPCETYKNNRSKRARSKGIKLEHRYVRRIKKLNLIKQVKNETV